MKTKTAIVLISEKTPSNEHLSQIKQAIRIAKQDSVTIRMIWIVNQMIRPFEEIQRLTKLVVESKATVVYLKDLFSISHNMHVVRAFTTFLEKNNVDIKFLDQDN